MPPIEIVTCWLEHAELIPAYEAAVAGARVVIVNQASSAPVTKALCEMVERLGNTSTIVHLDHNAYFAGGNMAGFAKCHGDITVWLNNDVIGADGGATNRWLDALVRDVRPGALYGPAVQGFDVDGEPHPYIEGWCLAGYRSHFIDIGGWNVRDFPKAYAEDVELCWRARRHGLSLYQAKWPIHHLGNVTNRSTVDGYAFADQQRERFREMARAARKKVAA